MNTPAATRAVSPYAGLGWAVLFIAAYALGMSLDSAPQRWLRLQWFTAYQQVMPRTRATQPAVVVEIDEASLAAYGQWPWPRTRLAEVIRRIDAAQPAAIGIDLILTEPDRLSPSRLVDLAPEIDPELAQRLRALPDHDAILATAIREAPVVLGLAAEAGGVATTEALPAGPRIVTGDSFGLRHLPLFPGALRNRPELEQAATGHGVINAEPEGGLVRRMLLLARIGDALMPSLAVEMLRVGAGAPPLRIHVEERGLASLHIGSFGVNTPADGRVWLRYSPIDPARYVSALDLIEGRADPGLFSQKLVLVAMTGVGLVDYVPTPLGERVPGVETHLQLIENLFDGNWLDRPWVLHWAELALFLGLATASIRLVPRMASRWAFAVLTAALAGLSVIGALAYLLGWLVDVATPAVGAVLTFALALGRSLSDERRQRRQLAVSLQAQREAAARVAGELDAARRVQMGMLPTAPGLLQSETRVSLAAYMQPAKMVGGDLYDFFKLDDDTLFAIVGDVSDKGLPAAMFMAMSKALCRSAALRGGGSLPDLCTQVEAELERENREAMFVTLLALTLRLDTGELTLCNAGHEPALLVPAAGGRCRRLDETGGPPLCVMGGFPFPVETHHLQPGDQLCVVTDGITEAASLDKKFYGRARLEAVLVGQAGSDPQVTLQALRADVTRFSSATEQSDDQAVVLLRWNGPHADVAG